MSVDNHHYKEQVFLDAHSKAREYTIQDRKY